MTRLRFLFVASLLFVLACKTDDRDIPDDQFLLGNTHVGIQVVANHLDVPWQLVWGPDNHVWFTEQGGKVSRLNPETGEITRLLTIDGVLRDRTSGLLGMAVHPDLKKQPYVFLNYSGVKEDKSRFSRVVRYTYQTDTLVDSLVILEYPGWNGHFGARVEIAPDGKLMIATGDGAQFENAQNIASPNGKILRYNIDGSIPGDNPFPGSAVWAWGLRNPQGLVYADGKLYNSDHGDAVEDEVNLIRKGDNYGWPHVEGFVNTEKEAQFVLDSTVVPPLRSWTPTIAPAGMAYYSSDKLPELKGRLLLTTLKGNSLRALELNASGDSIVADVNYFQQVFGRLRSVCVSPDGDVYLSTSNRDWNPNGFADEEDDRILRIYALDRKYVDEQAKSAIVKQTGTDVVSKGEALYVNYCASCHKANGQGIAGTFPALVKSPVVTGDPDSLIRLVLTGKNEMPQFSFIEDRDLAVILTYIRKRFGPQSSPISTTAIQAERVVP